MIQSPRSAQVLKKPTSVALDEKTVKELKTIAAKQGIPYQVLIRVLIFGWVGEAEEEGGVKLIILKPIFGVVHLSPHLEIPEWAFQGELFTITKTSDELSLVCEERLIAPEMKCQKGFRAFKVSGPLDFSLTGILADLSDVLAKNQISIFAISTFDTDYILVRQGDLEKAAAALKSAGHDVGSDS